MPDIIKKEVITSNGKYFLVLYYNDGSIKKEPCNPPKKYNYDNFDWIAPDFF